MFWDFAEGRICNGWKSEVGMNPVRLLPKVIVFVFSIPYVLAPYGRVAIQYAFARRLCVIAVLE